MGVHLPDLLGDFSDVVQLRERLAAAEMRLASPDLSADGYNNGVALTNDQIHITYGFAGVLMTTEHATTHYRQANEDLTRKAKQGEAGTASLAATLAQDYDITHLTLLGRQTGDANHDVEHPFKERVKYMIAARMQRAHISLHGMTSGQVPDLEDERSFDLVVGVGDEPSESTMRLGIKVVQAAQAEGLRAGINVPFIKVIQRDGEYFRRVDGDGNDRPIVFSAAKPETVRSTAEKTSREQDLDVACVQVELAGALRVLPRHLERNERVTQLGPYTGYRVLSRVLTGISAKATVLE